MNIKWQRDSGAVGAEQRVSEELLAALPAPVAGLCDSRRAGCCGQWCLRQFAE